MLRTQFLGGLAPAAAFRVRACVQLTPGVASSRLVRKHGNRKLSGRLSPPPQDL